MASSELLGALNRRREMAEAAGAVFEGSPRASAADTVWDQHHDTQFTPKGKNRLPDESRMKKIEQAEEESTGTITPPEERPPPPGKVRAKESPAEKAARRARLGEMPSAAEAAEAEEEEAAEATLQGEEAAAKEPAPQDTSPTRAPAEPLSPPVKVMEQDAPPNGAPAAGTLPVGLDVTVACAAEDLQGTDQEDLPTQPASPAGSGGVPAPALPRESLEFSWAPAAVPVSSAFEPGNLPAEVALRLAATKDLLNTSSRTYSRQEAPAAEDADRKYQMAMQRELELSLHRVQQQQYSEMMVQQQPFPKARGVVRQSRLEDVAKEVAELVAQVSLVVEKPGKENPSTHPAELNKILERAAEIQQTSRLSDQDLQGSSWPFQELQLIRELVNRLEKWKQCEAAAKQVMGAQGLGQESSLNEVVTILEQTFTAWRELAKAAAEKTPMQNGQNGHAHGMRICVDLGVKPRAVACTALISALLDKAIAKARQEPDLVAVRRMEALLAWQVDLGARSAASELGVLPLLEPMLRELSECLQGTRHLQQGLEATVAGGTMLSAPEVLWRAIVHGDVASVEAIIRQGGLVSGRTQDPSGHSVLWNAVAFERPEVALLLLRFFPPDMLHGVSLGELHQRNGNSLLHLVSSFQRFDSQSEGLFAMLFERMPEALRMHRNLKGQSFLHVAAGRRNFWILRYAAARGLASLFSVADSVGLTPRKLLEQHLAQLHIRPPQLRAAFGDTRLPSWCTLGGLKPGSAREALPFSDACVQVEWKGSATKLDAHRVILATGSTLWHEQLRQRSATGISEPQVLKVECQCVEVVTFALGYLYSGDLAGCSFQKDARRLLQLLQLCRAEKLPAPLMAFAMESLLLEIQPSMVPTLLLEAKQYQLPAQARQFLAQQFLVDDEAWQAAAEEEVRSSGVERGHAEVSKRSEVLTAALSELERPMSNFLG